MGETFKEVPSERTIDEKGPAGVERQQDPPRVWVSTLSTSLPGPSPRLSGLERGGVPAAFGGDRLLVAPIMAGGRGKYYAVCVGKRTWIYRSWDEAAEQVTGHSGAQHQSFGTYEEAIEYMSRRRRDSTAGDSGNRADSLAAQFRRCRVTTYGPGGLGASGSGSGSSSWTEAAAGGFAVLECVNSFGANLGGWSIQKENRVTASVVLNVFWEWHATAWVLERGLEVVAYGPVDADEGIARTDAVEMMLCRVLAATNEKMRTLEAENSEMKLLLGL
ncbi:hypothetical protein PIB30_034306 [Stylosanthes scabra]|uniref:Ribonuclease H1 N-terminal domain-containing protein n=1 Tax=Stylosanthes scabra TaxID=79078 RepID=A0ABU6RCX2_9FABA|nr:hypothetical protein [Stylosanthes scabra]